MKTTKYLYSSLLALGLTASAAPSYAQEEVPQHPAEPGLNAIVTEELLAGTTDPTFNPAEQVGLCLVESALSLLAAFIDHAGCAASFDLGVATTDVSGEGAAVIGGGVNAGGTTLIGTLGPQAVKGRFCNVDTATPGVNLLNGAQVEHYTGRHAWGRRNAIFNSDADIWLIDPQSGARLKYDETNIKDFFKRVIDGRSWEFDWGLEKITKKRYPRAKWTQLSWYSPENGNDGKLWVKKHQIQPRSAASCRIEYHAVCFNGSGEFECSGPVVASRSP